MGNAAANNSTRGGNSTTGATRLAPAELTNSDLCSFRLKEDTLYVPPMSKFQAPHPLSDTRSNFRYDNTVDMKRVMKLRKLGGAVIPTSNSLTDQLEQARAQHARPLEEVW